MAPGHQGCARHALCTRVTATLPTPHTDPGGWSMGRHASPQPSRVLLRPLLQALSAGGPHTDSGESPSRLWPRLHYPPVHAASLSHGLLGSRPLTTPRCGPAARSWAGTHIPLFFTNHSKLSPKPAYPPQDLRGLPLLVTHSHTAPVHSATVRPKVGIQPVPDRLRMPGQALTEATGC